MQEGLLYRLWETPAGHCSIKQLILPRKLWEDVLQQLHSSPTAGHLGVNKTPGRIHESFYWVQCSKDVCTFCKNYDLCLSQRSPMRKHQGQHNIGAPMEWLDPTTRDQLAYARLIIREALRHGGAGWLDYDRAFRQQAAADPSLRWNTLLPGLLASDYFTKWVKTYLLSNQEFRVLVWFTFDHPLRWWKEFLLSEMCNLLGIYKNGTKPLHFQSDGLVEQFNRITEDRLSKFVDDNQRDLDIHLPLLLMAYQTAK